MRIRIVVSIGNFNSEGRFFCLRQAFPELEVDDDFMAVAATIPPNQPLGVDMVLRIDKYQTILPTGGWKPEDFTKTMNGVMLGGVAKVDDYPPHVLKEFEGTLYRNQLFAPVQFDYPDKGLLREKTMSEVFIETATRHMR